MLDTILGLTVAPWGEALDFEALDFEATGLEASGHVMQGAIG
jgi:hypothetical protein